MRPALAALALALPVGCAAPAEQTGRGDAAGFPSLLPFSAFEAPTSRARGPAAGDLAARAEALRGRAAGLSGPVLTPGDRRQLLEAMDGAGGVAPVAPSG